MKSNSNNKQRKPKSNKGVRKFLIMVCIIVGSFLFIAGIALFGYMLTAKKTEDPAQKGTSTTKVPNVSKTKQGGFMEGLFLPPEKTNVLVMGVDQNEMLTDVIIVGSFDRETCKIDLVFIPRDTYVVIDKEDITTLKSNGKYLPSDGVMKINAIHSYAGKEYGIEYLKKEVEELLGIKINYYAEVNLKAFRNIVDAVDGIEMEIPKGGLHYSDPYQNLTINVPGGLVKLDGQMAEGVVRYRATYPGGDLQRIEVQQEFMRQFFKQVLNKEAIMKNAASFVGTIINYVTTDFGVQDVPMYLRYLNQLNVEKFNCYTLPGEGRYIGKASYFVHDPAATFEIMNEILNTKPEVQEAVESGEVDYKELKVQVLNGSAIAGKAGETSEKLRNEGFNVVNVGNYTGSQKAETRIAVRKAGLSEGFKSYFKAVTEEVDEDIPDNYDVIIIIGTGEK